MNEYSYQTLNVYKDAKALVVDVYKLLKQYPAEERYATKFVAQPYRLHRISQKA